MENNLLLFGSAYGVLLSLVICIKNPTPKKSKFWLGIFILAFALVLFDTWGTRLDLEKEFPLFGWTYYRVLSLIPLSLLFYINKTNLHVQISSFYKKAGLVFIFLEATILDTMFFSKGDLMNSYYLTSSEFIDMIGLSSAIVLFPGILQGLKNYKNYLRTNEIDIDFSQLAWLKELITIVSVISLIWGIVIATQLLNTSAQLPYTYIHIALCMVVFFIGTKVYLKPHIIHDFQHAQVTTPHLELRTTKPPDNKAKGFSKRELAIISEVTMLLQNEKIYRQQKLTVIDLAQQLNQSPKLLSRLINNYFGLNFNDYVNNYRVQEVKERLKNGDHKKFKILHIAMDAGFSSNSSFYNSFKKLHGSSPTTFLKALD